MYTTGCFIWVFPALTSGFLAQTVQSCSCSLDSSQAADVSHVANAAFATVVPVTDCRDTHNMETQTLTAACQPHWFNWMSSSSQSEYTHYEIFFSWAGNIHIYQSQLCVYVCSASPSEDIQPLGNRELLLPEADVLKLLQFGGSVGDTEMPASGLWEREEAYTRL